VFEARNDEELLDQVDAYVSHLLVSTDYDVAMTRLDSTVEIQIGGGLFGSATGFEVRHKTQQCMVCRRDVVVAADHLGKLLVLDAEASEDGAYRLRYAAANGRSVAQRLTPTQRFGQTGRLHTLHTMTCAYRRHQKAGSS
jgi:hypothetical protein